MAPSVYAARVIAAARAVLLVAGFVMLISWSESDVVGGFGLVLTMAVVAWYVIDWHASRFRMCGACRRSVRRDASKCPHCRIELTAA